MGFHYVTTLASSMVLILCSSAFAVSGTSEQIFFFHRDAYAQVAEFLEGEAPFPRNYHGINKAGVPCSFSVEKEEGEFRFVPTLVETTQDMTFLVKQGPQSPLMGGIVGNDLSAIESTDDPGSSLPGQYAVNFSMNFKKKPNRGVEFEMSKNHYNDRIITRLGYFYCEKAK